MLDNTKTITSVTYNGNDWPVVGGGGGYAHNIKHFTVTFESDMTQNGVTVLTDADIAEHYADENFCIMFHRRGPISGEEAAWGSGVNGFYSGYVHNNRLYESDNTTVYGILMGTTNANVLSSQSCLGEAYSAKSTGRFMVSNDASGAIKTLVTTTRMLPAGTYDIVVFW